MINPNYLVEKEKKENEETGQQNIFDLLGVD